MLSAFCDWAETCKHLIVSCTEKPLCSTSFHRELRARHSSSSEVLSGKERHESTPVGFEPTRGDPIGLAGRRLSRSAKVSSAQATRLSHLSNEKGSDSGQPRSLARWSLCVSAGKLVDLQAELGVLSCHTSVFIHMFIVAGQCVQSGCTNCRIPFGDHLIKLERYRED